MTEKRTGDEDEDDRETHVNDPSSPPGRGEGGGEDLGWDLESLPGKRPATGPKTPAPSSSGAVSKLPASDDFLDEPETMAPPPSHPATQEDPVANAPPSSSEDVIKTELPTREIDVEREMPTIVGDFASQSGGNRPAAGGDEAETVVDAGAASAAGPGQVKRTAPQSATPLSRKGSRLSGGTARDAAAGSAAARGTHPYEAGREPITLARGQLLAERYELIERLGKGGMGEVWKARHTLLQGMRAIKVIKASISRDPSFRQRFLQEGQTMMRVKHDGVVEVTDLDETRSNRELFMVMEYLQGRTIYDAIRSKDKPLAANVTEAVRILREVAEGMQRIHDERIVHKDLKSDNVLLVTDPQGHEHPKVIDFGLAKRLGATDAPVEGAMSPPAIAEPDLHTTLSGTLAYMAPEQFNSEPSSFQSDIYAFGVMAYETFSGGEYPLPRGTLQQYLLLHKEGKNPELIAKKRPDLDPDLTRVLDQCLATKREDRPVSFTKVAEDLQFWLDKPVRAERRRRLTMYVSAAAALVGVAVWGVFFRKSGAALSQITYSSAGARIEPSGGKLYLAERALPGFALAANIDGDAGTASADIDGNSHPVTAEIKDGKYVASLDLSDLKDGEHRVLYRPAANASASSFLVDVDRVAPKITATSVRGGVVTKDGVFTNADAPVVVVSVDEKAKRLASVSAVSPDGKSSAQGEPEGDVWLLKGTAAGEGRVELVITATDLAGNVSKSEFAYVKDTTKPVVAVVDEYKAMNSDQRQVHVRTASGSSLRVGVRDGSEVSVKFGDAPPVVRTVEGTGTPEFDVPPVPERGLPAVISVRDAAGNTDTHDVVVAVFPDDIEMTDGDFHNAKTIAPADVTAVVAVRKYKLPEPLQFTATRVRDASGGEVSGPAQNINARIVNRAVQDCILVGQVEAQSLGEGTYLIAVAVPGARISIPYTLTIDGTLPSIESVVVKDAKTGRPIGPFALAPELVVEAVVSDLSPERITLGGKLPAEKPQPGRHTYTFHMTCDHEGANTWPLVVVDGAKKSEQKAVTVNADWTDPVLALEPLDGRQSDDVTNTVFRGTVSEDTYDVLIEGCPDGSVKKASFTTGKFEFPIMLPAAERLSLSFRAVDPSGRSSQPVPVTLKVQHRATVQAAEVDWRQGVMVKMEQVAPGDVVIGQNVRPVSRVFVDKTEVTNREYREFLAAAKAQPGKWDHAEQPKDWDHTPAAATWTDPKWNADDLPVVNVAYWDAFAFANWSGRRLPTEAEWVMAATRPTSKDEKDARSYPAFAAGSPPGSEWKDGVVATAESVKSPVPAGKGDDVSPVGALHMGGNVSEWVDVPATSTDAATFGTRGGNWHFTKLAADVRHTPVKLWDRSFRSNTIGFRTAVDADRVQQP